MARPRTSNKHLPKYVTVIHGSYWYRAPKKQPVRLAAVGEESAMYSKYAEYIKDVPSGPITTMGDLFDRYIKDIVPKLAPRTQKDYLWIIGQLRKVFGDMLPGDIKSKHIGGFLDVAKGKVSRNRMVSVLSAVFTKAVGRWYVVDRNPCAGVERNESGKRDRYISDEEFKAVYAIMPPRHQIAMDLALLTGQRQGDLLSLKWEHVLEDGIYFQQGKTGKKLLVGYSPTLTAVLLRARNMVPQIPRFYVIRRRNGKPYTSYGFRSIWQRYMTKALGVKNKDGTWKHEPVIKQRYTFHDIRAKTVSDTVNIQDAFDRAGHTSMAMTRGVYDRGTRKVTPLK